MRLFARQPPIRRVDVHADLEAVTARGPEADSGVNVEPIWSAVREWYSTGANPAIQICLRRHGEVILNRSIGHAWGNAPTDAPDAEKVVVTPDTPFCVYSAAKGITVTVMHMLIERGVLGLGDRVCDYLPNFTSHGKHRITIRHVLSHSAGMPFFVGGSHELDRVGDSDYAVQTLCDVKPLHRPGFLHIYHAVTLGFLTREIVRAATGRCIRDVLATEILDPLGFRWTNYGVDPSDVPLVAPSHATLRDVPEPIATAYRKAIGGTLYEIIPATNDPRFLTSVVPSSSTVSNAVELSRFYEILRRGGELDGVRIMDAETLRHAVTPVTRTRPDVVLGLMPMRWGLGYMLGGTRFGPFGANTATAFGHMGLMRIAGWSDPQRGLSAGLITSGKPGLDKDADRFPALMKVIATQLPDVPESERPFVRCAHARDHQAASIGGVPGV